MSEPFEYDVFLSYNSKDLALVRPLAERLRQTGLRVWFDQWAIKPGDDIFLAIERGLDVARVQVLCLSPAALGSGWVRMERSTVLFRDPSNVDRRFVPILLADCTLPDTLRRYKYVDFREAAEAAFEELLTACGSTVAAARSEQRKFHLSDYSSRNLNFTGRENDLKDIREKLVASGAAGVSQTGTALTGLGGIGKTQLAIEYAFRFADDYQFIFLLHADDPGKIENDFLRIAADLKLGLEERDEQLRVQAVIRWLERNDRWLLIVDNVEHPTKVKPFLPKTRPGHILVTTRLHDLDELSLGIQEPVEVGRWTGEETREFLLKETNINVEANRSEEAALEELVIALDGLPLACSHVAGFVRKEPATFAEYWRTFQVKRTELFATPTAIDSLHPVSVVTTWHINFEAVVKEAKRLPRTPYAAAPDLLLASAFLSPDDIPMDLLIVGGEELGPVVAKALRGAEPGFAEVNQALHLLREFSLIHVNIGNRSYRMHRLVQEVIRQRWMNADQRAKWARRVIRMLDRSTSFLSVHYGNWPDAIGKQHHANFVSGIVMDEWKRTDFEFDEAADLLTKTGFMLTQIGRYDDAAPLLDRALETREKRLGRGHLKVAEALNYIGDNLTENGDAKKALKYYNRALKIRVGKQGSDDEEVAQVHNNLGIAFYKLSRYDEAESHYLEAKRIWENLHNETLVGSALFNLGQNYSDQGGKDAEVERLFRLAWGKIAPGHMRATAGKTLGKFLARLGRDDEAIVFLRESLKVAKTTFGERSTHLIEYIDTLTPVVRRLKLSSELAELDSLEEDIRAAARDDRTG
jgi:tetratricopeptide (TPR) repeat protein